MSNSPKNYQHASVLPKEVMAYLKLKSGQTVVDVTAGGGGHLSLIAQVVGSSGQVIALDQDISAHKPDAAGGVAKKFKDRVKLFHCPFSALPKILKENKIEQIDALLCDFGVSSPQLDVSERGFSFMREGPLDMRMNQESHVTAYDILKDNSEKELANIIYEYGEERRSRRIARAIKYKWPIKNSTLALAEIIARSLGGKRGKTHPATKTFQALRIATNQELDELDSLLEAFPALLSPNGRAVFIAFHSLEDRKVKHAFRKLAQKDEQKVAYFRRLHKKPITAEREEVKENARARSAKLRAIEKLGG